MRRWNTTDANYHANLPIRSVGSNTDDHRDDVADGSSHDRDPGGSQSFWLDCFDYAPANRFDCGADKTRTRWVWCRSQVRTARNDSDNCSPGMVCTPNRLEHNQYIFVIIIQQPPRSTLADFPVLPV